MAKTLRKLVIVGVTIALVATWLAMPAAADKENTPKEHKDVDKNGNPLKNTYINLGLIGDHFVDCDTLDGVDIDVSEVVVYDGTNPVATATLPLGGVDIDPIEERICLGGSSGVMDPLVDVDNWTVWIRDYIWNGCDNTRLEGFCSEPTGVDDLIEELLELADANDQGGATEIGTASADWQVDLKVAGFAEMRQFASKDVLPANKPKPGDPGDGKPATQTCVIADVSTLNPNPPIDVCVVDGYGVSEDWVRNINAFGFCGQGSAGNMPDNMGNNDWHDPFDYSGIPGSQPLSAYNLTTIKIVFVDGVVFYALDCPLLDSLTGTVNPVWNFVATTVNSVTCTPVCIFEDLPAVGSGCHAKKTANGTTSIDLATQTINLAVPGLIGEVGWNYEEGPCQAGEVSSNWIGEDPTDPAGSIVVKIGLTVVELNP